MTNRCEEHRRKCAIRTKSLNGWFEEQLGSKAGDGGAGAPSIFLVTFGLDQIDRDHTSNNYSPEIDQWTIDRAEDAAHCGSMLVTYICREVMFLADSEVDDQVCVSAFWSIDFPGSNIGSPKTNEEPSINVAFTIPGSLGHTFLSHIIDSGLTSQWQLNCHFVEFATVEEVGNSQAAISAAVDHVLKFSRTLPSMLFPDELMSFVTVNSTGMKVIRPTLPPSERGL